MQQQDDAAIQDTINAFACTVNLLAASGIDNHTMVGVLAGTLSARIAVETPEFQVAIRAMLVKKFSAT
jgi:hypothetical protein